MGGTASHSRLSGRLNRLSPFRRYHAKIACRDFCRNERNWARRGDHVGALSAINALQVAENTRLSVRWQYQTGQWKVNGGRPWNRTKRESPRGSYSPLPHLAACRPPGCLGGTPNADNDRRLSGQAGFVPPRKSRLNAPHCESATPARISPIARKSRVSSASPRKIVPSSTDHSGTW